MFSSTLLMGSRKSSENVLIIFAIRPMITVKAVFSKSVN